MGSAMIIWICGGHGPFGCPPGYAYDWARLCILGAQKKLLAKIRG